MSKKKEDKPKKEQTNKSFKVQGWKKGEEEPLAVDLSFEELIKLSVSGSGKTKEKPKHD